MEILLYKDNEGNIYKEYDSTKNREVFYADCGDTNFVVDIDKVIEKIDVSKIKNHYVSVKVTNDDACPWKPYGQILEIAQAKARQEAARRAAEEKAKKEAEKAAAEENKKESDSNEESEHKKEEEVKVEESKEENSSLKEEETEEADNS